MCRPPHFFYDPNRFHEQSRPFSRKSRPPPSNGKVLAWAAEGDAIHGFYLVAMYLCDISKVDHFLSPHRALWGKSWHGLLPIK